MQRQSIYSISRASRLTQAGFRTGPWTLWIITGAYLKLIDGLCLRLGPSGSPHWLKQANPERENHGVATGDAGPSYSSVTIWSENMSRLQLDPFGSKHFLKGNCLWRRLRLHKVPTELSRTPLLRMLVGLLCFGPGTVPLFSLVKCQMLFADAFCRPLNYEETVAFGRGPPRWKYPGTSNSVLKY